MHLYKNVYIVLFLSVYIRKDLDLNIFIALARAKQSKAGIM